MEVTEYLSTEVTSVRAKHRRNKVKKINTAVLVDVLLHLLHGLVGCDIRCVPSACEILSHHWLVHDPPNAVNSPYLLCLSSQKPSENY